jgi:hypothetical protein
MYNRRSDKMIKKVVAFFSLGIIVTGTVVGATSLSNKEQIIDHGGLYGDDSEVNYPDDVQDEEKFIECK